MDVNSLNSNKNQNSHEEEGKYHGCIKICDLPDTILPVILLKLPTKDAVRTSALSKRWIDQWKMDISKLDLEEERHDKREQFMHFVGRLLVVCEPSHIKKFSLAFKVDEDAPKVSEWLCGFINPNIQEVSLDFGRVDEPLAFPDHMFISKTLTKLGLCMKQVIKLPSSISFPNLKSLNMKDVIFPDSGSTQHLFSSFPSLEELTLIDCNWKNVQDVCIVCPLLQKLIIREWKDDLDDEDDADGMNAPNKCDILIIGTNLKTFSYDGDIINDYFFYNTNSVKDATIAVQTWKNGFFMHKLLSGLSNVENLSFLDLAMEALCSTYSLMVSLPFFHKLVELHVDSSGLPINLSCKAFLAILQKSPILKVVNFIMGVSLPPNAEINISVFPMCFGKHLKTIKIYNFSGDEGELNAIQFLLQKALVLDAIYIYSNVDEFDTAAGSNRLDMLMQQILGFPKAAIDCDIIFK